MRKLDHAAFKMIMKSTKSNFSMLFTHLFSFEQHKFLASPQLIVSVSIDFSSSFLLSILSEFCIDAMHKC